MNAPDWKVSWLLPCATTAGGKAVVMVGVARTPDGPMVAMQIGDDTAIALSPNGAVFELIVNLRRAASEHLDETR